MKVVYFKTLMPILIGVLVCLSTQAQTLTSLEYLKSISGKQTLAGVHNPRNVLPVSVTQDVLNRLGPRLGLWSSDLGYDTEQTNNRWIMIQEAKRQWDSGAFVSIAWEACSPVVLEPCTTQGLYGGLTDAQWNELITDGSPLNRRWKSNLDDIAVYLEYLQEYNVEVIFRPLGQMNLGAFWWSGRPGPQGSRKLYEISRDYLQSIKGLRNLIWVWDLQDLGSLPSDVYEYQPSRNYWDAVTLSVDSNVVGDNYAYEKYQLMLGVAGSDKVLGLAETNSLPRPQELFEQPRWCFFISGNFLPINGNFMELLKVPKVVTLDQLPRRASLPVNLAVGHPVATSSPNMGSDLAANAVDGNINTRWSSALNDDHWLQVNLGGVYALNQVRLIWGSAFGKSYKIQASLDGLSWATVFITTTADGSYDEIPLNVHARYVRMQGVKSGIQQGYSLQEFEIYGRSPNELYRP
jgi:mannan endo-1,4-beta-mannosidase